MMLSPRTIASVAVVERYTEVGGGCTHWGTIPSKALRHAVKTLSDMRANPLLRKMSREFSERATFPQLLSIGRRRDRGAGRTCAVGSTIAIACRCSKARPVSPAIRTTIEITPRV